MSSAKCSSDQSRCLHCASHILHFTLQAFKNISQEMSRILDIVGCYAVFKPEIGFTVKKQVRILFCNLAVAWKV